MTQTHAPAVVMPRQRVSATTVTESPLAGAVARGTARIAICNWRDLSHPEGGGSELYVENVARGLAAAGNDVTLLCAAVDGQPRDEVKDGVRYRRRGGRLSVYAHAALALLTGAVPHDVVVDVQNGLPWLSRLVTRRPVTVLVHHVHREQWPIALGRAKGRIGWWVESRVAPRLYRRSSYVTVSEATRDELVSLGVDRDRISVAHNGTPVLRPSVQPRSASPRIVVLGRLVPHKRVEVVLDAVAALLPAHPDLAVDVVGQGWWEPRLREHVARLGIERVVRFHGFVDDQTKSDLLAQAWVNAVPSAKEGWALSVVEAASFGVPSIAFAGAGGLDESIVDGVTGVLVEPTTGPAFTDAVDHLLRDGGLRASLGSAAARVAAGFSWPATVAAWTTTLDTATALDGLA